MFANLVNAQVLQGRYAAADSTMAQALRVFPANRFVRLAELFTLSAQKKYDSLEKRAAYMMSNDPDPVNRSNLAYYLRDIAFLRGRGAEGLRLTDNLFALEESRGIPISAVARAVNTASADVWHLEQPARAVQTLDVARARPDVRSLPAEERQQMDVSTLYSQAGRPDRARAVLVEYQSAIVADTALGRRNAPNYRMALGELALAERRAADAVREFRLSDRRPDGPRNSCLACSLEPLARAFDAAGMRDSAIVTYERYVTTPSSFTWPDSYGLARAHLRLGELYEAKSDAARAVRHYEKFVDLWKNADPPLQPRVAEARARLAALR